MKDNDGEDKEKRNVFKLLFDLQREKHFIRNEKQYIQSLNKTIKNKTDDLLQATWRTTKQRLFLLSQREFTSQSFKQISAIQEADFIEAKTSFGFQTTVKLENLLRLLRTQPEQLAKWLMQGEQLTEDSAQHSEILKSIVTGLYSSCLFPDDTKYMLKLLYKLAELQLVKSENPRRMLKLGTCSFRILYFVFNEVLPSAKFFLSAALEIPILRVLSYRDLHLDMDRDKSDMRFLQDDGALSFEFKTAANYRSEVVMNLAQFTNNFMASLRENVYSFPKPIAWIVYQISKLITKQFGTKEAHAIITELVFTLYICPAIVDPEQYSICDSQIIDSARHNLIQVGKIIQILALNKFESPDSKILDIYNLLDKDVVSNFMVDVLFNLEHDDSPPVDLIPLVPTDCALFSEEEFHHLIAFLQKVHNEPPQSDSVKKRRNSIGNSLEEQMASLTLPSSLENSPKTSKPYTNGFSDVSSKKSNFLSLVTKNHATNNKQNPEESARMNVLIFQLEKDYSDPLGFLSEDKILNMTLPIKKDVVFADPLPDPPIRGDLPSNYADEGSIGNTSDNLEAISEAASNHSVASSLELENEDQNDNLSDMISANVSGRGTPNISGRDTPSSQVNENEERPLPEARQPDAVQPQPQISRQIRSEIDDKFCKFEIKKLLEGDETISIISETWSTDVLASDNETIDAGDGRGDRPTLPLIESINEVPTGNILDISETQSESAWSTDVMTSDTERLTEVDNDDAGSVAQSEARSDDTRSETDENLAPRRLSNASSGYFVNHGNYNNYQEYRKVEMKNEVKTDNNANNVVFKSVTMTDQRIRHNNPLNFSEIKTSTYNSNRRVTTSSTSGVSNNRAHSKDVAGPSSSNFGGEHHAEILLSNCSLNSSSSGSSSNSFENNKTARREEREHWGSKQWLNSSGSSLNVTSTPSESTSELSVLSVSNLNNPAILIAKNKAATIATRTLKPSASTGAIPKSISFDMSADKGDKYYDDDQRNKRGGFFGKIKMGFRNRRGKSFRNQDDFRLESEEYNAVSSQKPPRVNQNNSEVSDDILAKYRTKPLVESSPVKNNVPGKCSTKGRNSDDSNSSTTNGADINNTFDDIKKKLRSVLSNTAQIPKIIKENRLPLKSKIETILRLDLGKARKLKEWSNIARISEAIRCINLLNESSCLTLVDSMKTDIDQRAVYTQYLICSRQELLQCESYLDGLVEQIRNENEQCEEYLSVICVRQFLLEQEGLIVEFCKEFKEINPSDEKCDSLNNFYEQLFSRMEDNPLWKDIFRTRTHAIKITLERFIMSKVYLNALYPNGDGDRHRDHLLHQHIETLSKMISPEHKYLMINKMFLREFPWIPAQDALKAMDAYRTPRDKVSCVIHCAKCIMDLLSFSRSAGSTTADDFTPVLVYVIITVNPRDLLSTIQFVDSFYSSQLCGEDHYWWTQFCSAVEYIKTMDYSD